VVCLAKGQTPASSAFNENPYRSLGVAEDASYEEVEQAFESLKEKYAGQTKKIIFLEIQKEKIYEDRLQQRLKGTLKAAVKESPYDRRRREALEKRTLVDRLPPVIRNVIKVPSKGYLQRTVIMTGILIALSFAIPQFTPSAIAMGFMGSTYLLYNRGQPERDPNAESFGPPPSKPVDKKVVFLTIGINLLTTAVFLALAQLLLLAVRLPPSISPDSVVATCALLGMFVSCVFFSTNEDNA